MIVDEVLSDQLFKLFASYIQTELGIKMPPAKKTMLSGRLLKRMRHLNIATYKKYYEFVFSAEGRKSELGFLMDAVTTNKTDFYREKEHFRILTEEVVPDLQKVYGNVLRFWSAPCSRGHEPYTMAMELAEYAMQHPPFDFWVLATDLSSGVLDIGGQGIYSEQEIQPVPLTMRRKYMRRGNVLGREVVKIIKPLRDRVSFHRMNFMDEHYGIRDKFHVVFCRNMLIYFEKDVQQAVIRKIADQMHPGGYLFMGSSESLNGLDVPVKQLHGSLYQLEH
mgnify:CR=1 FL=1